MPVNKDSEMFYHLLNHGHLGGIIPEEKKGNDRETGVLRSATERNGE